jgi:U4/U6 small nuclear ribonucleoprotein PRP3
MQRRAEKDRMRAQFGEEGAEAMLLRRRQEAEAARKVAAVATMDSNMIPLGQRASAPVEEVVEVKKELPAVPVCEWWDKPLLVGGVYDSVRGGKWDVKMDKINLYVEHPVLLHPPMEASAPPPQPLKLTKAEHKKLRTQRRLQLEKEKQEMIKQGLLEAPKPKVKISNMMRVMGMEATQDPTAIEREVRVQMEERQTAHDDRNLARKLTGSERREKKLRKMFEDTAAPEVVTAIYKIARLGDKKHQWKVRHCVCIHVWLKYLLLTPLVPPSDPPGAHLVQVDVNAQENRLSGLGLVVEEGGFSAVVVEGVSKSIKRYTKLLLRRIDWNKTDVRSLSLSDPIIVNVQYSVLSHNW